MNYPVARDLKHPLILTPLGLQFLKIWMVWYNLVDSQPTMILEEVSVKTSIKSFQLVQSDITLCYERESESLLVMSYSLQPCGRYSPWNSPGQNTGAGSLSCLQGIFPTQTSYPGLPHCRRILYQLSHKGSPRILEWAAYLISRGSSQPRSWTGVSCIAGRFCTNWARRGKPHYVSVQFSRSVVSDSLWPHGLQHTRLPCPSPTPEACSNSCPSGQWYHPTISFSILPFSSCLQFFPASGSFPRSQFFTLGGQNTGVSALASVLPMNIQDWFPLGWTGWISLQSRGLSRVFSNTTVQKHQFFSAQLSSPTLTSIHDYWKNHSFD